MKQLFIPLLCFFTVLVSGCASSKKSQDSNHINQNTSICDKTVKFIVERFKMIESGAEEKVHTEIIFNPTTKIITLNADNPEEGKTSFDTEIESIDCNLNEKITAGQAIYKGYVKQPDGSKTFTSLLIEVKDGQVYIKNADANEKAQYFMIVDRWEIIEN